MPRHRSLDSQAYGDLITIRRGRPRPDCHISLSALTACEMDLNFDNLRHECASRLYFDEGWTLYDVSILLGDKDVKRTERYIGANQKKGLHELVAKRALTLVKG